MDGMFKKEGFIGNQNGNIHVDENLVKDQLFAMFKSLMAQNVNNVNNQNKNLEINNQNEINNNQIKVNNKEEIPINKNNNKNITNFDDIPIKGNNNINFDDIPIKGNNNINYNEKVNNNINIDDIPIKGNKQKIKNKTNEKEIDKKDTLINNEEIPLPRNNNVLNVDAIEIKGTNDFNALLEKELAKGNYSSNIDNINTQPKFKYIPKPKNEEKYKISIPTTTKKYKYYSDNFKNSKKTENEVNKVENKTEKFERKKSSNNSQKRIPPIMPESFKNSKYNRGKNYIPKEENKPNKPKSIDPLWGDYNEENEEEDNNIENNIEEDENIIKQKEKLINLY